MAHLLRRRRGPQAAVVAVGGSEGRSLVSRGDRFSIAGAATGTMNVETAVDKCGQESMQKHTVLLRSEAAFGEDTARAP